MAARIPIQMPNTARLSEAFAAASEECAKLNNNPAFDGGATILAAINDMRQDMNTRFEQMEERSQQMEERFQQMDQRIDQRFQQMDQRIDQQFQYMGTRFDHLGVEMRTLYVSVFIYF